MSRVYHIFKVHDYKGGELGSTLNLTESTMLNEVLDLIGAFNEDDFDEDEDITEVKEELKSDEEILSHLKKCFEDNTCNYAGGESSCFTVYYAEDNKMHTLSYDSVFYRKLVEAYKSYEN